MAQMLFTARAGGVSKAKYASLNLGDHVGDAADLVAANREIMGSLVSQKRPVFMNQIHGDGVVEISDENSLPVSADAMVTKVKGLPLVVLVADCLPILLTSSEVVGAVHAGRKGVLNGIISNSVLEMRRLGATNLKATIGPAICEECYEVDSQMYADAIAQKPKLATSAKRHCLDLVNAAKFELEELEVEVNALKICTAHNENYFSYRRDGQTGRSAGVVVL